MRPSPFARQLFLLSVVMLSGCGEPPPPTGDARTPPAPDMAVVFDIDGTLTPKVHTINKVRPDAVAAVQSLAAKGYRIVYLSARVKALAGRIPNWLTDNGFPEGSVFVAQSAAERNSPAAFKAAVLKGLIEQGWTVEFAYGDSATDFEAYAAAGIPRERVFALLRVGKSTCQPGEWSACLRGWTEHLEFIQESVPPAWPTASD